MNNHPYAGPDTLKPGETADDDPYSNEQFCEKCDEFVEPIVNQCPACNEEIVD